jgi:hypothetical protein
VSIHEEHVQPGVEDHDRGRLLAQNDAYRQPLDQGAVLGHCRAREVPPRLTRYRSITNAYYKNAKGAILVYDIAKKESFASIKTWLDGVREYADPDLTAILIGTPLRYQGNKADLQDDRMVTTDAAMNFAKTEGIFFMEVSALTNSEDCVGKAFQMLVTGSQGLN